MEDLRRNEEKQNEKHVGSNKKMIKFKQCRSHASCNIKDITGFVYGGFSSRFWILRKQTNY